MLKSEEGYDSDWSGQAAFRSPDFGYLIRQKTAYGQRISNGSSDVGSAGLELEEPWIEAVIYVPDEYLGAILKLCQDRRGIQKNLTYVGDRAQITYELPLNEVVFDFYDRLKSISRGYASFDYHQIGQRPGDPVKMRLQIGRASCRERVCQYV